MSLYEDTNPIRSDLWSTMDVAQLNEQRDIIVNKITLMSSMQVSPTIMYIRGALEQALNDVDLLIDQRFIESSIKKEEVRV